MFFGHIGVALAAKPMAPKVSVGVMLVAATAIDILCGIFVLTGMEWVDRATGESYLAWSHGLFMSVVWSLLILGIALLVTKNWKMSLVIAGLVFSHWILDFISHPMGMGRVLPKDIPLFFEGSPKVGLGLYTYVIPALISEFGILLAGIFVYLRTTRPIDKVGKLAFAALILFLASFTLTMMLPEKMSFIATFMTLLFLPIGIWMERHRVYVGFKRNKVGE
jgi:hypothetical protein